MYYYQHHIGDFLRDTSRLSDSQCMAYLRLLWIYYDTERPLENDPDRLAFQVGANPADVRQILQHFFFLEDGVFHHARCDSEIAQYHAKSDKARESANKRWHGKTMRTHNKRNAKALKNDANQEPITNNHSNNYIEGKFNRPSLQDVQAYCTERQNTVNPEHFIDHYTANGWKVGKNPMKDWKAAVRTWEKNHAAHQKPDTRSRAQRHSDKLDEIARRSIEREIAAGTLDSGDFQKIAG